MQNQESDFRRDREKHTVQLRKSNRQQIFLKRRNYSKTQTIQQEGQLTPGKTFIADQRYRNYIEQYMAQKYTFQQFNQLCAGLIHSDIMVKHQAIIGLRKIISASSDNEELLQRVVDSGNIPILLDLMKQKEYPQLTLQACWIVTNVASGSTAHCQSILIKNGLDIILQLLKQNQPGINEQAIWAIGNIAGDCAKFRDLVITKGGVTSLVNLVDNSNNKLIISNGAWALSNMCRGTPSPKYQFIKPAIQALARIIVSGVLNDQILSDCLWAISSNSESQKSRIQRIVQVNNFVAKMFSICTSNFNNLRILVPSLRIIGNISTGNEAHTQQILKNEGLTVLLQLLNHQKKTIRREVCWIISNICAGTSSQINQVLSNSNLLLKLSQLFLQDELDVRREICYVFSNMSELGQNILVFQAYSECHVLEALVFMINQDQDNKSIEFGLNGLFQCLQVGRKLGGSQNIVLKLINQIPGFLQRLQSLQHHKSKQVYDKIIKIFQAFFTLQESHF